MGKRSSLSSPRKSKRRNRRRIHCSRCGISYSYSGSRSHVCPTATSTQSQTSAGEEQVPDLELNSSSEEETGFDCLQDNSETEEENTTPTRCDENAHTADTDSLLSAELRRRLKDRLRKRFNEEDLDYFDDDSSDENENAADCCGDSGGIHGHGHDSSNSVNEDWGDSQGSNEQELPEEDFVESSQEQNNSMPLSDKCGVLIHWLLLFLFSWQSEFSVTDSAMEMLLKFLSRFFWLVGKFNEDSFTSELAKHLPNTLYKLKKHLGLLNSDDFVKYVVCPKCKTLYDYKDCVKNCFGRQVSARCNFVPWFRHPHRSRRGKSALKVT